MHFFYLGSGNHLLFMELQTTDTLAMAARFINNTGSHVFLTGKAGTGKTTFLRQLAERTHKSFLIVAPTGIAALNAGGVTIHSQFLLPFGSFIPDTEARARIGEGAPFFNRNTLVRVHTLNSMRKKVLRATELLIIDEVSMLRADILDAIDFRMRRARGDYSRSFGGAQLLMIGDLHQLPPIVKEEEWMVLRQYYKSMHFFEAMAFREDRMVYIELDRIFRQQDDRFIRVLNNLRHNRATASDIELLNRHYQPSPGSGAQDGGSFAEEAIIITTHNRTADGINASRMNALRGLSYFFDAVLEGDFPEKLYPLPQRIELKVGAQLMFVRNDSSEEKAYVNGSLARVVRIEDEEVVVQMRDDGMEYTLKRESWEHKKYMLNEKDNEVEEKVLGTFAQYPVRPAWAVTVHKSQGLTFDQAVIDVGQAFAPGQVYVALSRLRSLDGLILRTRINAAAIMSDTEVHAFSERMEQQRPLPELLDEEKARYLDRHLADTFDFTSLSRQLEKLGKFQGKKMEFGDEGMKRAMGSLKARVDSELNNTASYRRQLRKLLADGNREFLLERIRKGRDYYQAFMEENLRQVLVHAAEVEELTRTKTYRNALGEIEQEIMLSLEAMAGVEQLSHSIASGQHIAKNQAGSGPHVRLRNRLWEAAKQAAAENPKFKSGKSGRKRKKGARLAKGESARITWSLVGEGRSVKEVATMRDLARSTIESHLVQGIREGNVDILQVIGKDRLEQMSALLKKADASIGEIQKLHRGQFTQGELRMVKAAMDQAGQS